MNEHTAWILRTSISPERVVAALTEFTSDRARIWQETSHPAVYRVHQLGATWAEVTEGVPHAWSRERYDWSAPGRVVLDQLDSNIAEPGGRISYTIEADGDGCVIRCDRRRSFRPTRSGNMAATYMRVFGPWIIRGQFASGLRRIEGPR